MFKKINQFLILNKINKLNLYENKVSKLHMNPRRAVLYVPGDDEHKIKKILNFNKTIDCVAFDLEDGVSINRKSAARKIVKNIFEEKNKFCFKSTTDWGGRVNSIESNLLEDDLKLIFSNTKEEESSRRRPETIFLPKVTTIEDLKYFNELLRKYLFDGRQDENGKCINLIIYMESCKSLMNLKEICRTYCNHHEKSIIFNLCGIVFGSDDFCASLGVRRSESSYEILYGRQKCVLIAKAFNLQAIDMVFIDFKNLEGFEKQCIEGANFGFTGKQLIHPNQIEICQNAFLPNKNQQIWARNVLEAYEINKNLGKGAFVFENQMIDAPTIKQAENIIKLIKNIEKA